MKALKNGTITLATFLLNLGEDKPIIVIFRWRVQTRLAEIVCNFMGHQTLTVCAPFDTCQEHGFLAIVTESVKVAFKYDGPLNFTDEDFRIYEDGKNLLAAKTLNQFESWIEK